MIGQRTRGLQSTLLLCQLLLVPVILILSGLLVFTSVTRIEAALVSHYPMYALAVMVGLLLESMSRDRARVRMNLWQHSFLDQHRVTVRQVAFALGALLLYLAGTKDQAISRWFLVAFGLSLYAGLISSNYWLPGILARQIFDGKWIVRSPADEEGALDPFSVKYLPGQDSREPVVGRNQTRVETQAESNEEPP